MNRTTRILLCLLLLLFISAPLYAAGKNCVPPCRSAYVCVEGACVSSCNPPCAAEEICTSEGECVSKDLPPIAPVAQPEEKKEEAKEPKEEPKEPPPPEPKKEESSGLFLLRGVMIAAGEGKFAAAGNTIENDVDFSGGAGISIEGYVIKYVTLGVAAEYIHTEYPPLGGVDMIFHTLNVGPVLRLLYPFFNNSAEVYARLEPGFTLVKPDPDEADNAYGLNIKFLPGFLYSFGHFATFFELGLDWRKAWGTLSITGDDITYTELVFQMNMGFGYRW